MGSGTSKSNSSNSVKPKATANNNVDLDEENGSRTAMEISKTPSNIDDIVTQQNSDRYRFRNDPHFRKVVLPRLAELVRRSKRSCFRMSTIRSEYCQHLQEIADLIRYEETDGEANNTQEEKQERPAVVVSSLSDIADKLGLVWTLAKTLKVLKEHRSPESEETEKGVRTLATTLCSLNANICSTYKKSGILKMVVNDLQNPSICEHYKGAENTLNKAILVTSIIIIDICAMHGSVDQDQKSKLAAVIYPYSRCTEKTIQVHAVLSLCQLQCEGGKDMFLEDDILVSTLLDAVEHARDSLDRCYADVPLRFLLHGLAQLASRDTNHSMLVSKGVLDLLKSVLMSGDLKENKVAVNVIWSLSFYAAAQTMIKEDPEMIELLGEQTACNMPSIRNAADAVIKHIDEEGNIQSDESGVEPDGEEPVTDTGIKTSKKLKHIMISYQWDTQEVLLRVRDKLKESGYVVWMDVDNIEGSTLQSMAEAVEDAAVVLVCFSHRYKSSPNARTEAEYAFQLRRDIVPLKMEAGYQADGWLGAIIGTKLYIELDPDGNDFNSSMQKLAKELGIRGQQSEDVTDAVVPKVEVVTRSQRTVSNWSNRDVNQWASQNGIKSRKIVNMVGEDLLFLKNLRKEAPEYFFNTLESKLGITSLHQIRIFSAALKNL